MQTFLKIHAPVLIIHNPHPAPTLPHRQSPPPHHSGSADQLQQAQDQFLERYWINVTAANTHIEASSSINISTAKRGSGIDDSEARLRHTVAVGKKKPWKERTGTARTQNNKDGEIVSGDSGVERTALTDKVAAECQTLLTAKGSEIIEAETL